MYYGRWSIDLSSHWLITGDEVIICHHADVLPEMKVIICHNVDVLLEMK